MKNLLILIAVLLVLAGGILYFFRGIFISGGVGVQNNLSDTTNLPNVPNTQSDVLTYSISTVSGGSIRVKDFKSSSVTVKDPLNDGQYNIGPHIPVGVKDPTASDNPAFTISYDDAYQSFTIVLRQEPIATKRQQAEQYLMAQLGISREQMCVLKYTLTVPASINQVRSGTNLGFSFCPGATQLP